VVATTPKDGRDGPAVGRRFYEVGGLTVQVESDLPITEATFEPKFAAFEVAGPGPDTIVVRHHFGLPDLESRDLGRRVYHARPWTVYTAPDQVTYIMSGAGDDDLECVVHASADHSAIARVRAAPGAHNAVISASVVG